MHRIIALFLALPSMMLALPAGAQERTPAPGTPATKAPTAVAAIPPAAPAAENLSDIGYMTASQLASRCSQNDPARSSYCFAYIAAVTDTARAYEIWLGTREFCLPARIAQSEIRRAFMTYVSAYPAQASGQAASVVVNALKLTYPCD